MTAYHDQVIEAAYLHSRPNCYFVGPYARRVSFASQQHRALDLVAALELKGRLARKAIAIVGAGVAGVTAAAALRGLGYELDLYEAEHDAMMLQKDAHHRVIHPTISRWPAERLELTTSFRVLDWAAGPCSRVVDNLRQEWKLHLAPDEGLRFYPNRRVVKLLCNRGEVTFKFDQTPEEKPPLYDLVLVTTGYGGELHVEGAVNISYWKPDQVDAWRRSRKEIIVSGCGDGGLIDALRLIHGNFNDGRLALELAHLLDDQSEIKRAILDAEDLALLAAKSIKCISSSSSDALSDRAVGKAFEDESVVGPLSEFYESLARKLPAAAEKLLLDSYQAARTSTGQVTLVSLQSRPFGPYAAPVHKLMMAHAMRHFFVEYKTADVGANSILLRRGPRPDESDILIRHGAHSNLEALLDSPERESLRIRQFLLADYIDKKDEHNFELPPLSPPPGSAKYIGTRHRMANELVEWMKPGMSLTAREDGFHLDGQSLANSKLGEPEQLFGIPLRIGPLPSGILF